MKKWCIGLLMAFVFCSCQKKELTLNFVVKDKKMGEVEIFSSKLDTVLSMSADGKGTVVLPITEPQYVVFNYKFKNIPVYVEPGEDFTTTWSMTPSGLEVSFEGGDGAAKNNFMNSKELKIPVMGDFGLLEKELLEKLEQYKKDNYALLESKGFDKVFVERDKQRIVYAIYGMLWQYARGRECTDAVYNQLKTLIVEDESLLQLNSYMNYLQGAVNVLANKGLDMKNMDPKEVLMNNLNYTLENIKSQDIKEFLIGNYALSYVDKEGVDGAESIKKIFDENIKNQDIIDVFYKVYNEGSSITKGKKAPNFKFQDINGKEVSLSDLKGKLVYIDIWATWCGPCREELPFLQKLEQALEGTNVCFVSISTDKDKAKWEATVKDEKLGGIQLYAGEEDPFLEAFRVKGIPRFILLDAEGKIMEANMSRPSDPKTMEYLSMYAELTE